MRRSGRLLALVVLVVAIATSMAGCSRADQADPGTPATETRGQVDAGTPDGIEGFLKVVTSTDIVGDVVAAVGADSIDLTVLIESGRDPHGYEPTPRALSAVSDADLVFINGLDLEENLAEVIRRIATGPVVAVSDGVKTRDGDPHTWMSPLNVRIWVSNIAAALSEADPPREEIFSRNAAEYSATLDELDSFIREQVATLDPTRRQLVTDHREFGYFAAEYGFREEGFVVHSSSTSAETGPAAIAELVELIRSTGAPAIFVGASAPDRVVQLARTVANETGARVVPVQSGSLAPPGKPGDNYLDLMRLNVARIVDALTAR